MYVDLFDLFRKINVTHVSLSGNSEFDDEVMGSDFPAIVQDWISAGPSMIETPLQILPFLLLFYSIPWLKMMCSWMVVLYVPSFHVSWRQYTFIPFAIIMSTIFSSLTLHEIPCTFWFSMVHVYNQIFIGIVVLHATCSGEHELYPGVVYFHDDEWWFSCGILQ